jgi:flavin reductase (DIM6/NTAB) family NADH-FMN oxidoreductase RutF
MNFDFTQISRETRYKLLGSTVVPRPIAWVSTLDGQGRKNVAPFSFFNVFGEDPPTVGFSILHRSGTDLKDTGRNIRERGEFVVNLVSDHHLDQMAISAIDFGPQVSEFEEAGLVSAASIHIATPRIADSRVSLECKLMQIIELGPMRSLVLGEVLMMHVADESVIDEQRGWIDTESLRLIGRMGPNRYVRTTDIVERLIPSR